MLEVGFIVDLEQARVIVSVLVPTLPVLLVGECLANKINLWRIGYVLGLLREVEVRHGL